MKKLTSSLGLIALLALIFSHQVRAEIIVNTGTPNQLGSPLMLTGGQWLAAEFSTTQAWQLNSLEGFINAADVNQVGATYTIAVYDNGLNNRPDTNSELFSQQATFGGIDGWNGLQGLNVALNAGNYWLAFEVRASDTLRGLMPVFAPNGLQTAFNDTTSNVGYTLASGNAYSFGARISAVPVPSALWLFASGLIAIGRRRLVKA
jgi:hypothetical protein